MAIVGALFRQRTHGDVAMLCAECVNTCFTRYKANLIDWQHYSRCKLHI